MQEIVASTPNDDAQGYVMPEECFTLDPDLIFDQASAYERVVCPLSDGSTMDFLIFARPARVWPPDGFAAGCDGKCHGAEVVAYRCDEFGCVADWERRYEAQALAPEWALKRLRYQLVNGLAVMSNYEGALADWEATQ